MTSSHSEGCGGRNVRFVRAFKRSRLPPHAVSLLAVPCHLRVQIAHSWHLCVLVHAYTLILLAVDTTGPKHHDMCIQHHLAPCTMHHAPCTMHHAPCTMHHAPCTINTNTNTYCNRQRQPQRQYLHDGAPTRVVHRDLKSLNVLVGDATTSTIPMLKICDFGTAREVHSPSMDLSTFAGTVAWMVSSVENARP